MKVAIFSDTHENIAVVKKAVSMLKDMGIKTIFHCGDLISPPMLEYFKGFDFKLVFGNNDGEKHYLVEYSKKWGFDNPVDTRELIFEGKNIFFAHESYKIKDAIKSQKYDFIFYGHSHSAEKRVEGKTLIINPGAMFRVQIYTFATLDLKTSKVEFHKVLF